MTFTLPLPPNRANARGHWSVTHRARKAYERTAGLCVAAQAKRTDTPTKYKVTATLYVHQRMDDDNAVARLKWPLDVLKQCGVLHDDKRPWCELTGIPTQVVDRKHQCLELTLEAA